MARSTGDSKTSGCGDAARGTGGSDTQGGGDPKSGITFQYNEQQAVADGSGDPSDPTEIKTGLGLEANDQE